MIRLLLTDGHASTRAELRLGLAATPGLEVVGESGTGAALLALLPSAAPTVVLLDLSLPGPDAFALLRGCGSSTRSCACWRGASSPTTSTWPAPLTWVPMATC